MIPPRNLSLLANRRAKVGSRRLPEAILERDYFDQCLKIRRKGAPPMRGIAKASSSRSDGDKKPLFNQPVDGGIERASVHQLLPKSDEHTVDRDSVPLGGSA